MQLTDNLQQRFQLLLLLQKLQQISEQLYKLLHLRLALHLQHLGFEILVESYLYRYRRRENRSRYLLLSMLPKSMQS
jgi:hypothetical protein